MLHLKTFGGLSVSVDDAPGVGAAQQRKTLALLALLAAAGKRGLGRDKLVAGPGQRVTVPAGTPHTFWNAGDAEVHFVCEVRPALQFESLLETMFALAADGKTNRKGMPNPFRLAAIAHAHFDTVQLPFPPAFVQRIGLALGTPLGRLLGYGPTYVPAAGEPLSEAA